MTKVPTLKEFAATAKSVDPKVWEAENGMDASENTVAIWVFDDGPYIEQLSDGQFLCTVYNDGFLGTKEEATKYLYQEFALTECYGDRLVKESDGSLDQLVADLLECDPRVNLNADDWGGIMGIAFSHLDSDEPIKASDVWILFSDAVELYQ